MHLGISRRNLLLGAPLVPWLARAARAVFEVADFGAKGDGTTLDTSAVNRAIESASQAGGGTVRFGAGKYLCYSIHLKNRVALEIGEGAVIVAADSPTESTDSAYDHFEPNAWDKYQDFGHSHWHNSLLWGEDLENIAIIGPGMIHGKGLSRGGGPGVKAEVPGAGNKAISLKNCRNVLLRDFTVLKGGHFGILATGVDNFTIDNLTIDTDRDGIDVDCCRNVRISNCSVNSPTDDGICLKSSFGLGYARATEMVTIANCLVSGFEMGSLLDGTQRPVTLQEPNQKPTGRIKLGTESNGGFKNIMISNCLFDHCRGLALETVDGAFLEDVAITNITMRSIVNAPIFLRLARRMRGPEGIPVGKLQRVLISNVICSGVNPLVTSLISGVPGHNIEDVKLSDIYIQQAGGGTLEHAARNPEELETGYPEPDRFGILPARGFYLRHVNRIEFRHVDVVSEKPDARPLFVMNDVGGLTVQEVRGVADSRLAKVAAGKL